MFRFLTNLFAADTASSTPASANKFRPQLTGMEDRYTPAALAAVAFDPQPEPPLTARTAVSTSAAGTTSIPGTYIPGTYIPGVTRGIVIAGG